MQFPFEINLQRMACISTAATIWEKVIAKNETKDLFFGGINYAKDKWRDIVEEVVESVKEAHLLPELLYSELLSAIKCMGFRIFGWIEHLKTSPLFIRGAIPDILSKYTKKIYWTHYGTIDEVKMFKLVWLNDPRVDIRKMYNIACVYCLEDEIKYFWGEIVKKKSLLKCYQHDYNEHSNIYKCVELNIIAFWDNVHNPSFVSDLFSIGCDDKMLYYDHYSVKENMLRLCAKFGYHIGFKYFWNQLDERHKKSHALACLKIILKELHQHHHNRDICDLGLCEYQQDKYREITSFLFQNLDELNIEKGSDVCCLLEENDLFFCNLIDMFMSSWPWLELLLTTSLNGLVLCNYKKKKWFRLFYDRIETTLEKEMDFHLPTEGSKLEKILQQFWRKTPSKYKLSMAQSSMVTFENRWILPTVKLILNDEDLVKDRQSLFQYCHKKLFKLLKNDEVDKIEQFYCELLVPRKFKQNDQDALKTIYTFLLQKDLNSADDFLNDDNSKRDLKKELEINCVIHFFIKKEEFDLANNFLYWTLESNEKVIEFKKNYAYEFASDYIFDIWSTSKIKLAVLKSNKVVNWLLNFCEDEIRKFKTVNFKECDTITFAELLYNKFRHGRIINSFLSWCSWTKTEIQYFRRILNWNLNRGRIGAKKCDLKFSSGSDSDNDKEIDVINSDNDEPIINIVTNSEADVEIDIMDSNSDSESDSV